MAVPFGIYDLAKNAGYVALGISGNTSEFAVNCLQAWWRRHGRWAYPHADRALILADGGGGNGYNLRTWKKDLQDKLCDAFGLTVTVSHYPPGCSKWNPMEYRPFSHISINWAGQPLRSVDIMLAFIRGTTTKAGLKVEARLDQGVYRKGRKVTERELAELALSFHDVRPRWNAGTTLLRRGRLADHINGTLFPPQLRPFGRAAIERVHGFKALPSPDGPRGSRTPALPVRGLHRMRTMLRHACGYALANKGHNTRAILGWLGHRSITSTAVYTALAPNRFKDFWRE